jgi:hypothetical protein
MNKRTEGGDERPYLIALILIVLSLIVLVKTVSSNIANRNSVWLEFSIDPNILSFITFS